jgi:hypothetical protein
MQVLQKRTYISHHILIRRIYESYGKIESILAFQRRNCIQMRRKGLILAEKSKIKERERFFLQSLIFLFNNEQGIYIIY